jgi:antirestriction protein ArdC
MKPAQEQLVADVVATLERGTAPWVRPWSTSGISDMPHNFSTQRSYHGVNVLQLWLAQSALGYATAEWCTFVQGKALGACVRKGERGTPVWFVKPRVAFEGDGDTESTTVRGVTFKQFTVFNRGQIDGLPQVVEAPGNDHLQAIERVDDYLRAVGADVRLGGDAAFYSIVHDFIACPEPERFVDAAAFYATQLHEHVHWTGRRERKNRTFGSRFGDKAYAFEELVAELGAAFLTAQLAIAGTLRHTEYLATWAQVLRDDPQALWTAAASASDAVAFLDAMVGDASTLVNVTTDEAA